MKINDYRDRIDAIDKQMLELMKKRIDVSHDIARFKRENSMPIVCEQREEEIIQNRLMNIKEERRLYELFLRHVMDISKLAQKSDLNIYLIGMPYSGKTTMLDKLKNLINRRCVDTDKVIENASGESIRFIFNSYGEEEFRKAETSVLKQIAYEGKMIVATGGGVLTRQENIDIMKNSGYLVLCDRPLEMLKKSYINDENDNRPLIKNEEDLEILYFDRFMLYRENADIVINTQNSSAPDEIIEFMKEKKMI